MSDVASQFSAELDDNENTTIQKARVTPNAKKGVQYYHMMQRPNMHVALHFRDSLREYASLRNVLVPNGEVKQSKRPICVADGCN